MDIYHSNLQIEGSPVKVQIQFLTKIEAVILNLIYNKKILGT